MNMNELLNRAAEEIHEADAVLVCAGAGMGVDSGLPDFRGDEGFWNAYPPYRHLNLSFIDMANPGWFDDDPSFAWGFYGHRLNLYRSTVPHDGFDILLRIGLKKSSYFVFTSNVDGQFQKAGFSEKAIQECHGSIHHLQCTCVCSTFIWDATDINIEVDPATFRATSKLPLCSQCGSVARPNIMMFGDWDWLPSRTAMQQKNFNNWLNKNRSSRIVVIEVGAGSGVPTVRMTSENIINRHDATLIRINTREPEVPSGNIGIDLGASEALTRIDELIKAE